MPLPRLDAARLLGCTSQTLMRLRDAERADAQATSESYVSIALWNDH